MPWRIDTIDLSQRARVEQLACGRGQLERLRPLNRNIAAAVAVAALFVLVSSITTASTGCSLIRSGSCLPYGEHVIPASCAPVAAVVSCCLTSRRQQARSRFAGSQLAEVLVLVPRGAICWSAGGLDIFRSTLLCVLAVCSRVCLGRDGGTSADWICGTLGGAHRMNFE